MDFLGRAEQQNRKVPGKKGRKRLTEDAEEEADGEVSLWGDFDVQDKKEDKGLEVENGRKGR